jgi:DNA invertase Pin-like site-specific DNA recombinase
MVVGYLRVSTGKQHLENQMDEISRYAASQNWTIDKWVTEVVSGRREVKSRKLGRLIKSLKRGDTIVVTEVSRLSRSLTEIMTIMGTCVKRGVNIYTTKEKYQFDDSINSKVLIFAFGLVAEIERNLISMRTREALAARKAEGRKLGRKHGFCPKRSVLVDNAGRVSEMIAQGYTHKSIYTALNISKSTFYKYFKEVL